MANQLKNNCCQKNIVSLYQYKLSKDINDYKLVKIDNKI